MKHFREQFPIFNTISDPFVYFDNASTTQTPITVIDAMSRYYTHDRSNVHRALYPLSLNISDRFEHARSKVQQFIGAKCPQEIVFTKGTTESINLVAASLSENYFQENDEIIVSLLEHHSNIVPWQVIAKRNKLNLRYLTVSETGDLSMEELEKLMSPRTKLVAITHVSNSLGSVNPIHEIIQVIKKRNCLVLIDAAQSIAHIPIQVKELNCDFLVFSGHKMYGPTGIGVLYGKEEILREMHPYQTGGNQIRSVDVQETIFADLPSRFEAGTPNIAGVIGLEAAVNFITSYDPAEIIQYEYELTNLLESSLSEISFVNIIGKPKHRSSIISFIVENCHPTDVALLLGEKGICLRSGYHCNEPLMNLLSSEGIIRVSLAPYNNADEIRYFCEKLIWARNLLNRNKNDIPNKSKI